MKQGSGIEIGVRRHFAPATDEGQSTPWPLTPASY
jgi:hypothetical protein